MNAKVRKYAILYGVWFVLILTGGGIATWWHRQHGTDTDPE